ncbi:hypothetical protein VCR12J2_630197 [Vibrio coralliirubri]|nr:hypothetical protein VCR12J2_630197 [Vibrio coralliirubri]
MFCLLGILSLKWFTTSITGNETAASLLKKLMSVLKTWMSKQRR